MAYGNIYPPSRMSALVRKIVSISARIAIVTWAYFEAIARLLNEKRLNDLVIVAALTIFIVKIYTNHVRREAEQDETEMNRLREQNQNIRWHIIDTSPIPRPTDQRPN